MSSIEATISLTNCYLDSNNLNHFGTLQGLVGTNAAYVQTYIPLFNYKCAFVQLTNTQGIYNYNTIPYTCWDFNNSNSILCNLSIPNNSFYGWLIQPNYTSADYSTTSYFNINGYLNNFNPSIYPNIQSNNINSQVYAFSGNFYNLNNTPSVVSGWIFDNSIYQFLITNDKSTGISMVYPVSYNYDTNPNNVTINYYTNFPYYYEVVSEYSALNNSTWSFKVYNQQNQLIGSTNSFLQKQNTYVVLTDSVPPSLLSFTPDLYSIISSVTLKDILGSNLLYIQSIVGMVYACNLCANQNNNFGPPSVSVQNQATEIFLNYSSLYALSLFIYPSINSNYNIS